MPSLQDQTERSNIYLDLQSENKRKGSKMGISWSSIATANINMDYAIFVCSKC